MCAGVCPQHGLTLLVNCPASHSKSASTIFSISQSARGAKLQARLKLNRCLLMAGYVPVQPGTCAAAQQ